MSYSSAGVPTYYKIRGSKIYLTPTAGEDYTVKGDYFVMPTKLITGSDTLPFNELLDDVIAEYMKQYFAAMNQGAGGTMLLSQYLRDEIDLVAKMRDKISPYHSNKPSGLGINWGWC